MEAVDVHPLPVGLPEPLPVGECRRNQHPTPGFAVVFPLAASLFRTIR